MPPDPAVVEDGTNWKCSTAEEFLHLLNPQHPVWQPDPTVWIFRGQASVDWPLLAKAHRGPDVFDGLGVDEELRATGLSNQMNQQNAALVLLDRFLKGLDQAGLEIPSEAAQVQRPPIEILHSNDVPRAAIPLLALAQHFGLPTNLLDWSRHAPKAAYFAAADVTKRRFSTGRLMVWALRRDVLDRRINTTMTDFGIVTAPAASNPNLRAQSGLFTQIRGPKIVTVDDYMRECQKVHAYIESEIPLPWMRKISIQQRSAARLLRLLSYSGINGASMFPGYAGVVRSLKEEALWD
jgi:hypothetical protein